MRIFQHQEGKSMGNDWKAAWQPLMDAVGQDFSEGRVVNGADVVTAATIRRYLEPLEFDCPLHYDADVAKEFGYDDVIAPNTSIQTFSLPPMWAPGQTIFENVDRNAQPATTAIAGFKSPLEPPTTGFFATDYEAEYLLPVTVGDRLYRHGAKLVNCLPKETKVGRGAFLTWEMEIRNQRNEVVARTRSTWLRYNPHEAAL
ncbi:MAG: MaoC family dehydratase N-terminal domain-containing protein [Akkermansiaceae bacterium]|nr:MaoC family dehydratase N-terminal domain-containing protein [Akkermansiaceae bacterium]